MAYKTILNFYTGELQLVNIGSTSGVTGIPPTTLRAIAIWEDTTGTTIGNSIPTIEVGGGIQANGFLTNRSVTTVMSIPSEYSWIAPELQIEPTGTIEIEADAELIII